MPQLYHTIHVIVHLQSQSDAQNNAKEARKLGFHGPFDRTIFSDFLIQIAQIDRLARLPLWLCRFNIHRKG